MKNVDIKPYSLNLLNPNDLDNIFASYNFLRHNHNKTIAYIVERSLSSTIILTFAI